MYNLTENQKNLLIKLVSDIRSEKLPEEFWVTWGIKGAHAYFLGSKMFFYPEITRAKLRVLEEVKLVSCRTTEHGNTNISLTQLGYTAVDSNFAQISSAVAPVDFDPTLWGLWKIFNWEKRCGLLALFGSIFLLGFGVAQIPQLSAIVQAIKNLL